MQSGNDRGFFTTDDISLKTHTSAISGLGIDALNHYLVSCSLDGTIKLWDFYRQKVAKSYEQEFSYDNLVYNRKNDLIAVSTTNMDVVIHNIKNGLKRVRVFESVADNRITDLCFSQPDSKWLLCSSLDKSLKIFDILTGSLIDWITFKQAPLSIDFSLSGEYLATCHVGSKAIFLWSNKSFYTDTVIQKVPSAPVRIDLPTLAESENIKHSHQDFYLNDELEKLKEQDDEEVDETLIDQKFREVKHKLSKVKQGQDSEEFMQLSNQPYSKWQAIFNLEEIKERNKPTLAKQELPKSPFFLFDMEKVLAGESDTRPAELLKENFFTQEKATENKLDKHGFVRKLRDLLASEETQPRDVIEYLKTLSPSGVELEFISLATAEFDEAKKLQDPNTHLLKMLEVFEHCIGRNMESDFVQAMLNNFLSNHHEIIVEETVLSSKVEQINRVTQRKFEDMEQMLSSNICMATYFAGINQF